LYAHLHNADLEGGKDDAEDKEEYHAYVILKFVPTVASS
jgi:hypothetical protein